MLNRVNLLVQIVRYLLICCIVSSRSSLISLGREFRRTRLFTARLCISLHHSISYIFLLLLLVQKSLGKVRISMEHSDGKPRYIVGSHTNGEYSIFSRKIVVESQELFTVNYRESFKELPEVWEDTSLLFEDIRKLLRRRKVRNDVNSYLSSMWYDLTDDSEWADCNASCRKIQ